MSYQEKFNSFISSFADSELIIKDKTSSISKDNFESLLYNIDSSDIAAKQVVGIFIPRSAKFIQVYMCFLSCKITAVPINQNWSDNYIRFVCKESGVQKIIYDSNSRSRLLNIFSVQGPAKSLADLEYIEIKNPTNYRNYSHDIAYIVFTSGSTNKPKGVAISNKALDSYVDNFLINTTPISNTFHLITGEISFDIIIADIVISLQHQKKLLITTSSSNIFEAALALTLPEVSSCYFVPSGLKLVIDFLKNRQFKYGDKILDIYCGGEYLQKSLCCKASEVFTKATIFNMYGPTETTVNCLSCKITPEHLEEDTLPTGKGADHLQYYFDSVNNTPVDGSSGELIICGDQVMTYYTTDLNNFEEIPDPEFYKTGDYFTYKHGFFYFSHRIDNEVKVRGSRVNLDLLQDHCLTSNILQNIVFIYKDPDLICFIVGLNSDIRAFKNHILCAFPSFCIPSKIIEIESIPLNTNGKIDKKLLAELYL